MTDEEAQAQLQERARQLAAVIADELFTVVCGVGLKLETRDDAKQLGFVLADAVLGGFDVSVKPEWAARIREIEDGTLPNH